jgi:hypothetical protein
VPTEEEEAALAPKGLPARGGGRKPPGD